MSMVVEDIIAHQSNEREREIKYKTNVSRMSSTFYYLILLELLILVGTAVYSVYNLRKFFVKKHIL